MLGFYWENGKENGSNYSRIGYILGSYWGYQMEKKMENDMESTILGLHSILGFRVLGSRAKGLGLGF